MKQVPFATPVWRVNDEQQTRRVGFELEFAGLDLQTAAKAVAQAFDGEIIADTKAECKVKHPEFGDFKIELDWTFAKNMARERLQEKGEDEDALMSLMTELARQVVPLEVVCPPIPIDRLGVLNDIVRNLQQKGALGTSDSLLYAFGVHINAELPSTRAQHLVPFLQAYCLAQHWLVKAHGVDPVRRLTPYIDDYSKAYVGKVLKYTTDTSLPEIVDDYLKYNPTRNRGMDMLPLFKFIDEARVLNGVKDERVNARPTFHYRLPNCEIEKPEWQLSRSWNIWCVVEHLAADSSGLAQMIEQWFAYQDNLINLKEEPWHRTLTQIHDNLLSV